MMHCSILNANIFRVPHKIWNILLYYYYYFIVKYNDAEIHVVGKCSFLATRGFDCFSLQQLLYGIIKILYKNNKYTHSSRRGLISSQYKLIAHHMMCCCCLYLSKNFRCGISVRVETMYIFLADCLYYRAVQYNIIELLLYWVSSVSDLCIDTHSSMYGFFIIILH